MLQPHYDDNDVWIDYHRPTDKECVYGRILELYSARQNYIQEESVRRLSVWLDWYAERMKPKPLRDESVVAACQSTISFLEDDYLKRKVDFATEVYAVLDKAGDTKRAKKVVDDLVELFPWLKKDFCGRLMNSVVAYDGLKNVSGGGGGHVQRGFVLILGRSYHRFESRGDVDKTTSRMMSDRWTVYGAP